MVTQTRLGVCCQTRGARRKRTAKPIQCPLTCSFGTEGTSWCVLSPPRASTVQLYRLRQQARWKHLATTGGAPGTCPEGAEHTAVRSEAYTRSGQERGGRQRTITAGTGAGCRFRTIRPRQQARRAPYLGGRGALRRRDTVPCASRDTTRHTAARRAGSLSLPILSSEARGFAPFERGASFLVPHVRMGQVAGGPGISQPTPSSHTRCAVSARRSAGSRSTCAVPSRGMAASWYTSRARRSGARSATPWGPCPRRTGWHPSPRPLGAGYCLRKYCAGLSSPSSRSVSSWMKPSRKLRKLVRTM